MRNRRFLWAGGMCMWLCLAFACQTERDRGIDFGGGISPEGLKAHLGFLADDALKGRRTGTRGLNIPLKTNKKTFFINIIISKLCAKRCKIYIKTLKILDITLKKEFNLFQKKRELLTLTGFYLSYLFHFK
jgi:hypothetical protein